MHRHDAGHVLSTAFVALPYVSIAYRYAKDSQVRLRVKVRIINRVRVRVRTYLAGEVPSVCPLVVYSLGTIGSHECYRLGGRK